MALKVRLQEYALIAEIIGGIAIVVSLIFVGFEVRQSAAETAQNTRAIEVAAYQDLIGQIIEINSHVMTDSEMMDIVQRGADGSINPTTESVDAGRYFRYWVNVQRHADLACFMYQQGVISKERLAATIGIYIGEVLTPHPQFMPEEDEVGIPGLRDCVKIAYELRGIDINSIENSLP